jgi:hypothetical protein
MIKRLLPFFAFLLFGAGLNAQCGPFETAVRLEINPDYYYYEVSWKLIDLNSGFVFAEGAPTSTDPQTFNYCISQGSCVVFQISDSYGDGMAPDGHYQLYLDDELYYEYNGYDYGFGENVTFGCPPGGFCSNPIAIDLGNHTTINDFEIWYSFTPQDTGTYRISTCDATLNCPTKIWVYDMCQGITLSDDNLGTTFYADGGCDSNPNGAEAELYLAAGTEYYIRMGYANGSCSGAQINFSLEYIGPVIGCTDPEACNFQPLATVSGDCIYPGDPDCTDLPDLIVLEDVLRNSLEPDVLINDDECYVEEGCIKGFGNRYILRFTTHIKNIGSADYFIGQTPANPSTPSDQFIWDPCHNHWHYRGYAEYVLFDSNGTLIPIGSKNGFCVLDLECSDGGDGKFTCSNMGITAQCGDIYDAALPCQWVDLTDIPAGFYTLVVRVNWDKSPDITGRYEATYENNWAQACFELIYDSNGNPIINEVNDCPIYTDCFGEAFGPAQPDCNGDCGGALLHGDWNLDTLQTADDVALYLNATLNDNGDATPCHDLDDDGNIDIYDAALLQECALHADDPQYWGTRFACQFPAGVYNPDNIVYLIPESLDTAAKTFDIQIINPYSKLFGFEFAVSGLEIASIENLDPGFVANWEFNPQTNKLMALSVSEEGLQKNILPGNFIRIHYSSLTAPEICISEIFNVVSENYHLTNAQVLDPSCISTGITSTGNPAEAQRMFVSPNPANTEFNVFFSNPKNEAVTVILTDASGQTVRAFQGIRQESVRIERDLLPAGMYFLTIQTSHGIMQGKVVFK